MLVRPYKSIRDDALRCRKSRKAPRTGDYSQRQRELCGLGDTPQNHSNVVLGRVPQPAFARCAEALEWLLKTMPRKEVDMSQYRLLAVDMDGTLLTSDKSIDPASCEALRKATEAGVIVALLTGRDLIELKEYRDDLAGCVRYASLLSGAHLVDLADDSTLSKAAFATDTALAVAHEGQREDAMIVALSTSEVATRRSDVDTIETTGLEAYQQLYYELCTFVDDPCDFIRANEGDVCKISVFCRSRASMERLDERLKALPVTSSFSEAWSIEVSPAGVSKASGLETMADYFGITLDECVMVGDGLNDLEVLKVAGLSVAMGNARSQVKEIADVIVADNDHGGIAEAVERFFL